MGDELTIFYASDFHGSDTCFGKWLNAGSSYQADVVVLGGDLTGKLLIPIYPAPGPDRSRWTSSWSDRPVTLETDLEVAEFKKRIRKEGAYAFTTTPEEMAEVQASSAKERELFNALKLQQMRDWIEWADSKLAGVRFHAYVIPGNDDPPQLGDAFRGAETLDWVQGRAVELGAGIWMASRGESTPTPWHTPGELSEEELCQKLQDVISQVPADAPAVWNFHIPPYASGVDSAPRLDATLTIQHDASGEPLMIPVGSTSVRQLILEHQPLLGLHGHVHEGRGKYVLGRTTGFNPGSVYPEGRLQGVLVRLSAKKGVRSYTFTSG
jgi:uncharacterized protein